jgi:hypothetical protein
VLRLLLSTAFGMSLEDLPPSTQQRSSCEMLTRAASFYNLCSSIVCHREGDTGQGDTGSSAGYPLRAVLYDILHSVRSEDHFSSLMFVHQNSLIVKIVFSYCMQCYQFFFTDPARCIAARPGHAWRSWTWGAHIV